MGFRIRTNINDLNAQVSLMMNYLNMNDTLSKLSTGLRINKAADDVSGLQIADTLGTQANTLNQSIRNINDTIGTLQIADRAMDEQERILDVIKVKATQAAQDGQTFDTRKKLQNDIVKLLDELDNIALTTQYNGKSLLSGTYTNKEFQIGAYSYTSIKFSIDATSSNKIGNTRFETGVNITDASRVTLVLKSLNGLFNVKLQSVDISFSAGTGIGVLAEVINKNQKLTGVKASWQVITTGNAGVSSGSIKGLTINGVKIGDVEVKANDATGSLLDAINKVKNQTGVEAYINYQGRLNLKSIDGRGIVISASSGLSLTHITLTQNYGRLTLTKLDGRDIIVEGDNSKVGFTSAAAQATINLRTIKGPFSIDEASAIGAFANASIASQTIYVRTPYVVYNRNTTNSTNSNDNTNTNDNTNSTNTFSPFSWADPCTWMPWLPICNGGGSGGGGSGGGSGGGGSGGDGGSGGGSNTTLSAGTVIYISFIMTHYGAGVTTLKGAMAVMDIVDSAMEDLDKIRAKIGAVQNQLQSTLDNITVTKINVKAAESQIRDVDFAAESAKFKKYNLLALSGSYAMAQSNITQKNVLDLLKF